MGYVQSSESQATLVRTGGYLTDLPALQASAVWGFYEQRLPVKSISGGFQVAISDKALRLRFNQLAQSWKEDTLYVSSTNQIASHPAYRQIIDMGKGVLPLIFQDLKREPDFWFDALVALTGENPVGAKIRGDVSAMTKVWLRWARKHGYC